MTDQEAFKLGFFAYCVEQGMTPDQVNDHVCKLGQEKRADGLLGSAGNLLGMGGALAAIGAVGLPLGAGYVGGTGIGKAQSDAVSSSDVKNKELILEYKRLAARARLNRKIKELQEEGKIV